MLSKSIVMALDRAGTFTSASSADVEFAGGLFART
jgi:hypothetical protein